MNKVIKLITLLFVLSSSIVSGTRIPCGLASLNGSASFNYTNSSNFERSCASAQVCDLTVNECRCETAHCELLNLGNTLLALLSMAPFVASLYLSDNLLKRVDYDFKKLYWLPADARCISKRGLAQQISGVFLIFLACTPFLNAFFGITMTYMIFGQFYIQKVLVQVTGIFLILTFSFIAAYFGFRSWSAAQFSWPHQGASASFIFLIIALGGGGLLICILDAYSDPFADNDAMLSVFLGIDMVLMSYACYCSKFIFHPLTYDEMLQMNSSPQAVQELKDRMKEEQAEHRKKFLGFSLMGLMVVLAYALIVLDMQGDYSGVVTFANVLFSDSAMFFGQLHGFLNLSANAQITLHLISRFVIFKNGDLAAFASASFTFVMFMIVFITTLVDSYMPKGDMLGVLGELLSTIDGEDEV